MIRVLRQASGTLARPGSKPNRARQGRARCEVMTVRTWSADGFGPGLLDPIRRRGRFIVALAWLWPIGRCGDVADRNGDYAIRIPAHERIFRVVLAEPGDRVLIALVIVGTNIEIARGRIHAEPFELADDRLVLRPSAGVLVGALDGGLEHVQGHIGAFRLEVRVFVPALEVALDECLVQRPAVAAGIREIIVGLN